MICQLMLIYTKEETFGLLYSAYRLNLAHLESSLLLSANQGLKCTVLFPFIGFTAYFKYFHPPYTLLHGVLGFRGFGVLGSP